MCDYCNYILIVRVTCSVFACRRLYVAYAVLLRLKDVNVYNLHRLMSNQGSTSSLRCCMNLLVVLRVLTP